MSRNARIVLKCIVWALCLTPLAILAFRANAGDLTANPIPSLEVEVRGAIDFLKVVQVTAASLSLSVYASLS